MPSVLAPKETPLYDLLDPSDKPVLSPPNMIFPGVGETNPQMLMFCERSVANYIYSQEFQERGESLDQIGSKIRESLMEVGTRNNKNLPQDPWAAFSAYLNFDVLQKSYTDV